MYHVIKDWDNENLRGPSGESLLHFALQEMQKAHNQRKNEQVTKIQGSIINLVRECPSLLQQTDRSGRTVFQIDSILREKPELQAVLENSGKLKFEAEMEKTLQHTLRESQEGKRLNDLLGVCEAEEKRRASPSTSR